MPGWMNHVRGSSAVCCIWSYLIMRKNRAIIQHFVQQLLTYVCTAFVTEFCSEPLLPLFLRFPIHLLKKRTHFKGKCTLSLCTNVIGCTKVPSQMIGHTCPYPSMDTKNSDSGNNIYLVTPMWVTQNNICEDELMSEWSIDKELIRREVWMKKKEEINKWRAEI